jgi:hypothetical protein
MLFKVENRWEPLSSGNELEGEIDAIANNAVVVEGLCREINQRMGRTSMWELPAANNSVYPESPGVLGIGILKFKGATFRGHRGEKTGPSTREYRRINPHLGFDNRTGDFIPVLSKVCPEGGITVERARSEVWHAFNNTLNDCPSASPVALYVSDDPSMRFVCEDQNSPLAVAVTGLPRDGRGRFDELLTNLRDGQLTQEDEEKLKSLGLDNSATLPETLAALSGKTGETMFAFHHRANSCRYSGYPNNLGYTKEQDGKVFLTDLDTSVQLSNFPEKIVSLQMIRDLSSLLYGTISWCLQRENISHFEDDDCEWFDNLMRGYHPGIDESVLADLKGIFLRHYRGFVEFAVEQHSNIGDEPVDKTCVDFQTFRKKTRTQYWIERKKVYMLAMSIMWTMNMHSELNKIAPLQFDPDHLFRNVPRYSEDPELGELVKTEFGRLLRGA